MTQAKHQPVSEDNADTVANSSARGTDPLPGRDPAGALGTVRLLDALHKLRTSLSVGEAPRLAVMSAVLEGALGEMASICRGPAGATVADDEDILDFVAACSVELTDELAAWSDMLGEAVTGAGLDERTEARLKQIARGIHSCARRHDSLARCQVHAVRTMHDLRACVTLNADTPGNPGADLSADQMKFFAGDEDLFEAPDHAAVTCRAGIQANPTPDLI